MEAVLALVHDLVELATAASCAMLLTPIHQHIHAINWKEHNQTYAIYQGAQWNRECIVWMHTE